MRVRDRILGIETELGVMLQTNGEFRSPELIPTRHYSEFIREYKKGLYVASGKGYLWHPNGSLSYLDYNDHPEHATAECRSARDIVTTAKAGELIIADVFNQPYIHDTDTKFILFKNNLAFDANENISNAYGCHDNYSLHGNRSYSINEEFRKYLIPFLITRQILDGAGWWDKYGRFHLSQRAMMIRSVMTGSTTGDRGLVHFRGNDDTGTNERLHLILGDSNILETALYLKIGVTSLILALVEQGLAPRIECEDPVRSLRDISFNADPHGSFVDTANGERLSALEVQYRYFERAHSYLPHAEYDSEVAREESLAVLSLWEKTLEAINSRNEKWIIGRLDYATKKYLFEQQCLRMTAATPECIAITRKNFDIYYHNITDRILQEQMNTRWASRRIVSDAEILHRTDTPPPDTRANLRGAFVKKVLTKTNITQPGIVWNKMEYRKEFAFHREISLQNPFRFQDPEFDSFLEAMENS